LNPARRCAKQAGMNYLFDLIRSAAKDDAAPFLHEPSAGAVSYGQAFDWAARYANVLTGLGVKPGDRVAVQVEKSPAMLFVYLACVRAGAVFLPLNTAYTLAELDYFIGDAEPALIICDPSKADGIGGIARGAKVETLDKKGEGSLFNKAAAASALFQNAERDADDLAAILYTSGTTGRSKGAMLSHANLASNSQTLVKAWRWTSHDVLLHALPIYHTHGLFVATNVTMLSGASMIFMQKFDPDLIFAEMPNATAMMGVPTFYVRLVDDAWLTRAATAGIRVFISGSAPLLADTHRAFFEKTGHAILERYGMTETNMNTSNPYDGERVPGTVGFALPGVDVRVVDSESGATLAANAIGMIEVRGPNVFKGYWRMPEKTASEFKPDGFFITGDLGKIDARGYVHIVGRGKDLVISGGFNVYPKEVETEIDALPGVIESAVIGVPHKDFGEGVTAIVVAKLDGNVSEEGILAALSERLAKFKQPKRVIVVSDLPRNAMGKVQKNVLRETYKDLFN
jgi:malonyl-CoA/methylmalonyl-CoA synthetase